MKLIFAQGNLDTKYDGTRHNVGFVMLDAYANAHHLTWSEKSKFHAFVAEEAIGHDKLLLIKPTTYYNDTGLSARALIDFYNLDPATDLLVIHDDLALDFGKIRIRAKGSDAGNNGIKSLNSHIGPNYHRVRIGIRNELQHKINDVDFVLGKFNKEESDRLQELQPVIFEAIEQFISGNLAYYTKKLAK